MAEHQSAELNSLVEIRLFGQLKKVGDDRGWDFPYLYNLEQECSALELAELLELPLDEIEGVFVDGIAKPIDEGRIASGSRVGFIPYGVPGPYRIYLGYRKTK